MSPPKYKELAQGDRELNLESWLSTHCQGHPDPLSSESIAVLQMG